MMMRWYFMFLFLVVFSSMGVFALCPSGVPSDSILKLSGQTNAHGELGTGTSYTADVCYAPIFTAGQPYTGMNPYACTGINDLKVFMSGVTNAHFSLIQSATYNTPVCYADLTCMVDQTVGNVCNDASYQILIRLSATTNAHAERIGTNTYPVKICCKQQQNMVWVDASGNSLPLIDHDSNPSTPQVYSARGGETVYAAVKYFVSPDPINQHKFTVFERDGSGEDSLGLSSVRGSSYSFSPTNYGHWYAVSLDSYIFSQSLDASGGTVDSDAQFTYSFRVNGVNQVSPDLFVTWCNDRVVQSIHGETCDAGPSNGVDGNGDVCSPPYLGTCQYCTSTCTLATLSDAGCGDGVVTGAEECDRGANNQVPYFDGTAWKVCTDTCILNDYNAGSLVWTNLVLNPSLTPPSFTPITQAQVGDYVYAKYPNAKVQGFVSGGDFRIYEDDDVLGETDITTLASANNGYLNDNDYYGLWRITQADYDAAIASFNELGNDKTEFKFSIDGKEVSDDDALDITLGDGTDDPLTPVILDPSCGRVFRLGLLPGLDKKLPITFKVEDKDDLVSYELRVEDELIAGDLDTFIVGGEFMVDYSLVVSLIPEVYRSGTLNIRLDAKNTRGKTLGVTSNVIVIDDILGGDDNYVAACIDSPKDNEHIDEDYAFFDASKTIAKRYSAGSVTTIPLDQLTFEWVFSDGTTNPYGADASDPRAYSFYKYFPSKGGNAASLKVRAP